MVLGLALALATVGSACDDDGGSGVTVGPEDDFVGTWWIQGVDTNFQLACPTVSSGAPLAFPFFTQLDFKKGEATDLFLASEECFPGLPYDVNDGGTAVQVTNPDPYTGMAPTCGVVVELPDTAELGLLELLPGGDWSFTLRPEVAGEPRQADLGGTAQVQLTTLDAAGMPVVQAPCTYTGIDRFMRVTRS